MRQPRWFPVLPCFVLAAMPALAADGEWPSYNRTLTSERHSPLAQISAANVAGLEVVCSYDTKQETSFQTGPIVVDGTLYATTEMDTFALDPATCAERWRVHEDVAPSMLKVNRGVAYLHGRLFRGLQDGRVVAYDAATGKRAWERRIADPAKGESVPAAPIAWDGLVFVGNAGGDNYGVKGRMYALDAATGAVRWEFYLVPKDPASGEKTSDDPRAASWGNEPGVPISGGATWTSYTLDPEAGVLYVPGGNPAPDFKPSLRPGGNEYANSVVALDARTGAYRRHWPLVEEDFHDWDVAAAPVIARTPEGAPRLYAAPKDGHLYGFDLASGKRLFRTPVTTIENADTPLTPEGTRFCPGTQGGNEWNGPAYDPDTRRVFTGAVDWCTTVRVLPDAQARSAAAGQPWTGAAGGEAKTFGKLDPVEKSRGWLTATDAETGKVAWRFETPRPILGAVTPTAGGLVFFGDMAGNFYAFDKRSGKQVHHRQLDGALGGGVIVYEVDGKERIALAVGMTSPIWPTAKITARLVVLGLPEGSSVAAVE